MRLFSYIVSHDTGFAPNPFWGYCTLATCKPNIRKTAEVGDYIVGLTPKRLNNRVVYAMRVDEVLDIASYFRDHRFKCKQPRMDAVKAIYRRGDNIYEPQGDDRFHQLKSAHFGECGEDKKLKEKDLKGKNVLISKHFTYFGQDGPELPHKLDSLKVGRAHKCHFPPEIIKAVLALIDKNPRGVVGPPRRWPSDDQSWCQEQT